MEILREQNPISLFQDWLDAARATEPEDAEAMALATASARGAPSVRMVLLKDVSADGFTFYTNMESRKGLELAENPRAALCFYWKTQRRQVRVEGAVVPVDDIVADAYFKTRHFLSRIGAWASLQSRPLDSRGALEGRVADLAAQYEGKDVDRPPHWGGYRVVPDKIEFWQEGEGRLHDRFLFTKNAQEWNLMRLNP